MKRLMLAVARNLPRELQDYYLIKRQNIYIPYYEIGITCLTKETTELNLFFETILKLVEIEVDDVNEISEIMGIEFKLLKEAIVDMIEQQYVITSQNKLIMTQKGRKALVDRKQVSIRKTFLNELSINLITGEIGEGGEKNFVKPAKGELCLGEEQTITKDFLESNYGIINEIYQKNQIESNIFRTRVLQRELYKILDIAYEKLRYVKDELLIYKNNDSEDYEFIIKGDIGERYQNSFYRQVRDVIFPGMINFFERDWNFSQKNYDKKIISKEDRKYTKELVGKLNRLDSFSDELLEDYMHARALIDEKELETIFAYCQEFNNEGIVISCERLKKLLTPPIVEALNQLSKKRIWILYNEEEYDVEKMLEKFFGNKIKKKEVSILKRDKEDKQFICFYPSVLVEFVERTENIFNRPITFFEGHIEFDADAIRDKMDYIMDKNKISFSFPKSKKVKGKYYSTKYTTKKNSKKIYKPK